MSNDTIATPYDEERENVGKRQAITQGREAEILGEVYTTLLNKSMGYYRAVADQGGIPPAAVLELVKVSRYAELTLIELAKYLKRDGSNPELATSMAAELSVALNAAGGSHE